MVALGAMFFKTEDGNKFRPHPYYDSVGVLTACGGLTNASAKIIGHTIVEGATYTPELCQKLFFDMAGWYNTQLRKCVHAPVLPREVFAYLHFAWNIGVKAFCGSTLVKKLNARNYTGACDQILVWMRAGGKDCRVRANDCYGIVARRHIEHSICTGTFSVPGLPAIPLGF